MDNRIKILLFEKNDATAQAIEAALSNAPVHYVIHRAAQPDEFVNELKYFKPCVVVTGAGPEGYYSQEVMHQVRGLKEPASLFVISPRYSETLSAELMQLEVEGYLPATQLHLLPIALSSACRAYYQRREMAYYKNKAQAVAAPGQIKSLAGHLSDAVSTHNASGQFTYVTAASEKLLQMAPAELVGRSALSLIHPADAGEVYAGYKQMLQNGKELLVQFRARRKDGKYVWLECKAKPLSSGGEVVAFSRDISARKQAEDEIRELNFVLEKRVMERTAELEAANRQLKAFNHSVSHDLKGPLRTINGYAKLLTKEISRGANDSALQYAAMIAHDTTQLQKLVDDLMAFTGISNRPPVKQKVCMQNLVAAAICAVEKHQPHRANITVNNLPADTVADESMLKLVLINLIGNALKYSAKADNPQVEIGARKSETETVFYVKDNGVGFSMGNYHQLFKDFGRLHAAAEFDGNGLGLSIARHIIEKHGGTIWAEAEENKGAVFYFSLPVNYVGAEGCNN